MNKVCIKPKLAHIKKSFKFHEWEYHWVNNGRVFNSRLFADRRLETS
jgi:hypothetical protein